MHDSRSPASIGSAQARTRNARFGCGRSGHSMSRCQTNENPESGSAGGPTSIEINFGKIHNTERPSIKPCKALIIFCAVISSSPSKGSSSTQMGASFKMSRATASRPLAVGTRRSPMAAGSWRLVTCLWILAHRSDAPGRNLKPESRNQEPETNINFSHFRSLQT